MVVRVEEFGWTKSHEAVHKITLTNDNGVEVELITYGATIRVLKTPDRAGQVSDIVLGFDTLEGYLGKHPYFGAIVGRVANRIANGQFLVDNESYQVVVNNGPNHLHGGLKGYDKIVWRFCVGENQVTFHHVSLNGDEGYPGDLDLQITYSLNQENALEIKYFAKATKPTPVNLTNHSYFNLGGEVDENVLDHIAEINAPSYLPTDKTQIPTGEIVPVDQNGGVFDFTHPKTIGKDIEAIGGYDHNFCLKQTKDDFCARVHDPKSGRVMEVFTSQPGVQFYTASKFDDSVIGKGGIKYKKYQGFCLETQNYPNAINQPNFPNSILRPGAVYNHYTTFKFSTQ